MISVSLNQFFYLALYTSSFFFLTLLTHIIFLKIIKDKKELNLLITNICIVLFSIFLIEKINLNQYFLILNLAVILIYIEFYSLISRGFTLSIITNIEKKRFSLKQIEKFYANKNSLKWMLKKRVSDLNKLGLIKTKKYMKLTMFGNLSYFLIKLFNFILCVKKNGQ